VSRLFSFDHTQTHTTVGRTPLDEGSARRRDLYLTTQTLYKRQTSVPPVGFEPMILASARPQTYALDRCVRVLQHKTCRYAIKQGYFEVSSSMVIIFFLRCLLPQAISPRYFCWTSGDPHRSGFKIQTAVLSVLCVMFQVRLLNVSFNYYYYYYYY
jgi:hypothetical protein